MNDFLSLPFVHAFLQMIANALDFKGRTKRSDFWWATLGVIILAVVLGFVFGLFGVFGEFLRWLVCIVLFVPQLSMSVRRLHDTNRSGLWLLLVFTVIGSILLIIWFAQKGQEGDNFFGPDPESNYGI